MPNTSKRTFLLSCALLASQALHLPGARAAPPTVTLFLGDTLDTKGRQKQLQPWRRKLFDYLEQELAIQFDIKVYPWTRAERHALNGEGLIFGLPKTASRLRELHYSDAASNNTLWLVTRSDAVFPFNGLQDLRGKTLGAVRGYSYGDEFECERNKLFRVDDEIASRATRLQRLLLKRVDAVLLYQPSGESQADFEANLRAYIQPYLKDLVIPPGVTLSVLHKPLQSENGMYFAVAREQDDGLIERINLALARQRKLAQR